MSSVADTELPADRSAVRQACCAVASYSPSEVALVHSLVEGEFTTLLDVVTESDWQTFARRTDVAVLLLAFGDLTDATNFHHRYTLLSEAVGGLQAQVVMLCSRQDVPAAYALCRSHDIADYVMFWPFTHDPKRLPLALHRACDAYEDLVRAMGSGASTTTAHASAVRGALPVPMPMGALHVLIVEDDRFQLTMGLSVLISAGLKATGASGAQAALAMLETSPPQLILLDVDMPDMNGLDLLRELKATPRYAHIPVIMLTVTRERGLVLEALRDGAADFIVKPFERDTLLQKISRFAVQAAS